MSRAFNFSAGPAALPESVLRQVQSELLEWRDERASVIEVSHRGKAFIECASQAEKDLRELMQVPDDYAVLFLQGGATALAALLPLNLARADQSADYLLTGHWGEKALENAKANIATRIVASDKANGYRGIPPRTDWQCDPNAAYFHLTTNETIHGVALFEVPDTSGVPIVADMSSGILSRPVEVSRYGVIYAGAQKNLGPAGVTICIIRKDLLGKHGRNLPPIFELENQVKNDSMFNTPTTFSWYVIGLVLQWVKAQGGAAAMEARNRRKAEIVYQAIDGSSGFYRNPVQASARSWMNIPFMLPDEALDKPFLAGAEAAGLLGLKGHRAVGGMRASLYNALGVDAAEALSVYMGEFARKHG